MSGQARFIYADADMIAAQRAGWTWFARLRNLAIAYATIALFNVALLAALNAAYGTRPVASDPLFVIGGGPGRAGRLLDVLRAAGVRERRRFGLIVAEGAGAP